MYIYDQAHALVKSIRESEEFKLVKKLQEKIDGNNELKQMFGDYRVKQIELQRMQVMGLAVPDEKMQEFRSLHDIVIANSTIKEFLDAEMRFVTIMADIQKIMVDGLGLN